MSISVIIPCYNHGKYILDAVESVRSFKCEYEIIIVNDGSDDTETLSVLEQIKKQDVLVIDQENGGPSKARNTAIAKAKGDYILPLDSDNIINTSVFEKALEILKQNLDLAVVYTDAEYIGEKTGVWRVGKVNKKKILILNQIDTCSLIRKHDLISLGCYDEDRDIMSNEDWELWLRMLYNDKKFYYLEEVGFKYRVNRNSLSAKIARPNYKSFLIYLVKKYPLLYVDVYKELLEDNEHKIKKIKTARRYFSNYKFKAILKILLGRKII